MRSNEDIAGKLDELSKQPIRQSDSVLRYMLNHIGTTKEEIQGAIGEDDQDTQRILDGHKDLTAEQFHKLSNLVGVPSSVLLWSALMHDAKQEQNQGKIQVLQILEKQLRQKHVDDKAWEIPRKEAKEQ